MRDATGSMSVRRAEPADADALARLHQATVTVAYVDIFPPDAPPPTLDALGADYAASLAEPANATFVTVPDVVGSIALVADATVPAGWRIETFNVHPDRQGAGVGRLLYAAALDEAVARGLGELNLWVLEDNARARSIYERWGWSLVPGHTYVNEPSDVLDVLYELDLREPARFTS